VKFIQEVGALSNKAIFRVLLGFAAGMGLANAFIVAMVFIRPPRSAFMLQSTMEYCGDLGTFTVQYLGVVCVTMVLYAMYRRCQFIGYERIEEYPKYKAIRWSKQELADQADYFQDYPVKQEIIVASAILDLQGTAWSVMRPGRHFHCIQYMAEHGAAETCIPGNTREQGFMTNTNRYIGRKEARALAFANGQAKEEDVVSPRVIFSEDLWKTPKEYQYVYPKQA
jgi:hypothetical protein